MTRNNNSPKKSDTVTNKYCILIPARNESQVIEQLLISIEKQTKKINSKDVYIIVESKEDPTVEIVKKHNMNILDEYTEYKETENNDNKIVDNLSEEEYVSHLNDEAMLSESDFHFLETKMKTDWEHIKKVMNRSDDIKVINGAKVVYKQD